MTKILQIYSNFSFYNTVYSAHTMRIKHSIPWCWYVCWWSPSVIDTLFLLQKVLIG